MVKFNGESHPNNSVINFENISTTTTNGITCITDQFPCCSGHDLIKWVAPSNSLQSQLAETKMYSQAVVLYRNPSEFVPNGLFHCQIQDSFNQTHYIYIGVYLQGFGK